METKRKTHTKASLNLYLVAGLYLLYVDYSLLSKWNEVEPNKRIVVGISAIAFGIFAIGIMTYSLKGIIAIKKRNEEIIEEIKQEEENDKIKL